jgi:pyrroloquinoline quinone (PQQ) biosynthesis protein C
MLTSVVPFSRIARLRDATRAEQDALLSIPFVKAAVAGRLTLEEYRAFLGQAYHHVKHTVPLLMSAGAALGSDRPALQSALCHYVDEERGHEQWILNDIEACGGDPDAVRAEEPGAACEVLVAYAYDVIRRTGPVGFFGMVHVLEGTSVLAASQAAEAIGATLRLPSGAFSYLSSHGALDLDHVDFFAEVLDLLEPHEFALVSKRSRIFYKLYGDVFRSLSPLQERV